MGSRIVIVALVLAGVAVLAAVVVLATGRGGELTEVHPDHPPLPLPAEGPITGTEAALLQLPRSLWGYQVDFTDEAMRRLAWALSERDARVADLEQQLAELRQKLDEPATGAPGASGAGAWAGAAETWDERDDPWRRPSSESWQEPVETWQRSDDVIESGQRPDDTRHDPAELLTGEDEAEDEPVEPSSDTPRGKYSADVWQASAEAWQQPDDGSAREPGEERYGRSGPWWQEPDDEGEAAAAEPSGPKPFRLREHRNGLAGRHAGAADDDEEEDAR